MTQADRGDELSPRSTRRRLSERAWRRILWWGGLAVLIGVYLFADKIEDGLGWPFWMVGPVVFSAARLIVIGTTVGILAWAGCFWLWLKRPCTADSPLRANVVTIVVAIVLIVLDGLLALEETSDAFRPIHVLSPASPGGCRLVLWREPDSGYGQDTYGFLKVPGSATLRKIPDVVRFNPDSSTARWRLTWSQGRASLTVWDSSAPGHTLDGVFDSPVVCPAR